MMNDYFPIGAYDASDAPYNEHTVTCPYCDGYCEYDGKMCEFCGGTGEVSKEKYQQWYVDN